MEVIECVANVSTADYGLAERLGAVAERAGAALLDMHLDADHNRSVLTLAAPADPAVAAAAAGALAAECVELIDLRRHRGLHPRLGALDVCPFVPLGYHDRADGLAAALDAGHRAADAIAALGVPVFAYDRLSPSGVTLPQVRRDAFERLRPSWGPPQAHPSAGATAVGVRDVLVAFNVDLVGADLATARSIAAAIRESGGGPPGLRALGLELAGQGRVQVSMNLTRPWECGIAGAWAAVSTAASAHSVDVGAGELVGLVPKSALAGATDALLTRCGITQENTIETALTAAWMGGSVVTPFELPAL